MATTPALDFAHRWVPPTDPAAPTLLLLHGTGGNEEDLLPLGEALAPGAGLLSPRGKVLERGMPRFFRRLAEGVFDVEDIRRRTAELADFIAAAADAYGFDRRRLVATGFSNGANIAASLLLLRPESLGGAILYRPMVPLVPEPLPSLGGRPVLVSAGRQDPMSPPGETDRLVDLLDRSGATVTLRRQQAGHNLVQGDVDDAVEWLAAARNSGFLL
jgi:predicted esterase